jgi:hypothetical protein
LKHGREADHDGSHHSQHLAVARAVGCLDAMEEVAPNDIEQVNERDDVGELRRSPL